MTPAGYTEDALIERPAIALLAGLGWETVNAYDEFDHGASTLGRETKTEVILTARLRPALQRFNPEVPPQAIAQAIEELTRDRSRMSLVLTWPNFAGKTAVGWFFSNGRCYDAGRPMLLHGCLRYGMMLLPCTSRSGTRRNTARPTPLPR